MEEKSLLFDAILYEKPDVNSGAVLSATKGTKGLVGLDQICQEKVITYKGDEEIWVPVIISKRRGWMKRSNFVDEEFLTKLSFTNSNSMSSASFSQFKTFQPLMSDRYEKDAFKT